MTAGDGPVVAATLIAELPTLIRLDRRRIAALARLAPIGRDSGKRIGRRPTAEGALSSGRCSTSPRFTPPGGARCRRVPQRLLGARKPVKAAITATARKLLGVLNAMLKTGSNHRQTTTV